MGMIILIIIAIFVVFFISREGRSKKKSQSNTRDYAKNRLLKEKSKNSLNVPIEKLVYPSSKKFHKKECRYADLSKDPITIHEAKSRGLKPCKICKSGNIDTKD